jgi:hypothetical protein
MQVHILQADIRHLFIQRNLLGVASISIKNVGSRKEGCATGTTKASKLMSTTGVFRSSLRPLAPEPPPSEFLRGDPAPEGASPPLVATSPRILGHMGSLRALAHTARWSN